MKKRNNPWYYYLNGKLIKKRKPAMPGDIVLISRHFTSDCIFTIVDEVHIGGFHDQRRRYFKWDDVFKASEVLNELTDLRNFRKNWGNYNNLVIDSQNEDIKRLKAEINTMHEDLSFAWKQASEAQDELNAFKDSIKSLI